MVYLHQAEKKYTEKRHAFKGAPFMPSPALQSDYSVFTDIFLGVSSASEVFGNVIVRTPFLKLADTLSISTCRDRGIAHQRASFRQSMSGQMARVTSSPRSCPERVR